VYTKETSQEKLLTSSGETVDAWASRETSVTGACLTEALVTLGAASCPTGSSAVAGEVKGAAVASFGGSSSSLQQENKLCITRRKQGKSGAIEELE
jgi:hypothetical protein